MIKVDNAIILAAGMSTRFVPMSIEHPKALMKVKGEVLIERLIKQLQDAGISDIIVVTGYKAESLEYLKSDFGVTLIHNPEYESRNNHSSLYYAQEFLKNTYICSSDNYYPSNVFDTYEESAYYSTVYVDGPTDEWIVQTDNEGYINSVIIGGTDGDIMLGHAFFDKKFSERFLEILNQKYHSVEIMPMFWESVYVENLDSLKLKIKRHPKENILEFDNLKELKKFDNWYKKNTTSEILKNIIKTLDLKVKDVKRIRPILSGNKLIGFKFKAKKHKYRYMIEEELLLDSSHLISNTHKDFIRQVVQDNLNDAKEVKIKSIRKLGGLTNNNYLVKFDNQKIVFRLAGDGSNELIDRHEEKLNIVAAKEAGVDAEVLFFNPNDGVKITRFVDDSITLSNEDFSKDFIIKKVAKLLKHLHDCNIKMEVDFNTYNKIEYYEKLISNIIEVPFEKYNLVKEKVLKLKDEINNKYTFCHNDALPENFILDHEKLYLIDWEYAGMNHPFWDLAQISVENRYNREEEKLLFESYFGRSVTEEEIVQIQIQKVLVDFLWSLWGLYFSVVGKDYMDYANDRYQNCLKNLEILEQFITI